MTLVVPNAAEEAFLDLILAEGYTLRLFTNDPAAGLTDAQVEALTAGAFTEATFPGYASAALTGGAWTTTQGDDASTGTYAQQTFTRSSTGTGQQVRGYYVTRTTGGALRWFEYFPGPITVDTAGDTIRVTPTFTLDDDREATVAARGVIARMTPLTVNSSNYGDNAVTDFAIANVDVDSSRRYKVHVWAESYTVSAPGDVFLIEFRVDGVVVGSAGRLAGNNIPFHAAFLWEPATGQVDLDLFTDRATGSGTIAFRGAAARPRQFWVEDVGPR